MEFTLKHSATCAHVLNNTYHSSIKATPAKLLFGIDMRGHLDIELVNFLNDIAKVDFNILDEREKSRELAIKTINKIKEYNKQYYDKRHKKTFSI